jgi:FKBP-type peptidyl-prolyl cis-trans isomerase SlyD
VNSRSWRLQVAGFRAFPPGAPREPPVSRGSLTFVRIDKGKRVRLKVRLEEVGGGLIEDGEVEYVHGGGSMLAGLEAAVTGLEKGATKEGVIAADQAFGDRSKQPTKTIPRDEFPSDAKLEVGAEFAAKADNGQPVVLEVSEVSDKNVVVRLVHPLAKKDISYKVEVLAVLDRTPPPLPADAVAKEE